MKKRDLFAMNEMDLKLNTIIIFYLSVESFRILECYLIALKLTINIP